MSIYNESEKFIKECFESLINQTFSNFEVIVVLDNPSRHEEVELMMQKYGDSRFKLHCNEKNIGLADSMNVAVSISSSEILARMDADDICFKERFLIEYDYIQKGYDVVFSKYIKINEESEVIDGTPIPKSNPSPQQISAGLIYRNSYIHHPTVMMTKASLLSVGGYRSFPCSQDFDLWLRMNENGSSFYMCEQPLVYYRVNSSSVSSKRWYQQRLTIFYIFKLSVQRVNKGTDSFSVESYNKYLQKNGLTSEDSQRRLREALKLHSEAITLKQKGNKKKSVFLQAKSFIHSPLLRNYYINVIKKRLILTLKNRKK